MYGHIIYSFLILVSSSQDCWLYVLSKLSKICIPSKVHYVFNTETSISTQLRSIIAGDVERKTLSAVSVKHYSLILWNARNLYSNLNSVQVCEAIRTKSNLVAELCFQPKMVWRYFPYRNLEWTFWVFCNCN